MAGAELRLEFHHHGGEGEFLQIRRDGLRLLRAEGSDFRPWPSRRGDPEAIDFTGDGVAELSIQDGMGLQSARRLMVFQVAPQPRLLARFRTDLCARPADVDQDGTHEIVFYDRTFAYWGYCGAMTRVVMSLRGGRLAPALDLMRSERRTSNRCSHAHASSASAADASGRTTDSAPRWSRN